MKKTLVLCTHNRPIHPQTVQALNALRRAGAALIDHSDAPTDVTLARNLGLSAVCEHLDRMPARDVVLLVDYDMVFSVEDAQALADHARAECYAASAMYVTAAGALAAYRLEAPGERPRWLTGLGLLAIPSCSLLALRAESETFAAPGGEKFGFTQSGVDSGQYLSEDFTLCKRLGGVDLLPVAIGHVKPLAVYPDDDTVAAVREGRALSAEMRGRWRGDFMPPALSELTGVTEAEYAALVCKPLDN